MKKNVLIGVVVAIVVVALVVVGYFVFGNKGNATKDLDLAAISKNISENTDFAEMAVQDVDKELLSSYFQIDATNVEEVYGKMPLMRIQASVYLLLKATDGKVEDVKAAVEEYGRNYEEQWSRYLPAQHELVQNRKIGVIGNTVYLVVAEQAEDIVKLIK